MESTADLNIEDRIRGCIFGQALGDALGFGAEGLSKTEVLETYKGGLVDFGQVQAHGMRALRKRGMWTDDTSQMLCILESLVEKRAIDPRDVARKLTRWLVDDGFGCGQLVYSVLSEPDYLLRPEETARRIWEQSGKTRAPNGAVMRTSVVGIWHYDDLQHVASNAGKICKITHADPRCVASCVAVSVAAASLINSSTPNWAIHQAATFASAEDKDCGNLVLSSCAATLEELDLDHGCSQGEQDRIGYTYTTVAAAFWAVYNTSSFEDGVVAVINEGGDADTNAAVAGALLGARFGFSGIPQRWVDGLAEARYLHSEVDDLLNAMGLTAKEPPDPQRR